MFPASLISIVVMAYNENDKNVQKVKEKLLSENMIIYFSVFSVFGHPVK